MVTLSRMQRACQSRQILFSTGYGESRARNLPRQKGPRQDSAAMGGLAPANAALLQGFRSLAIWSSGCIAYAGMDSLTAIAASGLRSRMESLDLVANNVANASTGGYKADREFYSLYLAPEAEGGDPDSTMPVIERPWVDLSQGTLQTTGNALDVALSGSGFFAVQGPGGSLYTRNGSFRLAADGKLSTTEGYPLAGADGKALTLTGSLPIDISADGTVRQNGNIVGQLQVVDFPGARGLRKQGTNYFRLSDPATTPPAPAAASVEQGKLEGSNTGTAESAIRLVSIMRQFEMLQKAVSMANDMNKEAIEQVAKV